MRSSFLNHPLIMHSHTTAVRNVLLPTITITTSLVSGLVVPDFKTVIVKPLFNPSPHPTWQICTEKRPSNFKPTISVQYPWKCRSTQTPCTPPRKQLLQSFPVSLPHQTQHRDRTPPTRCKRFAKRYRRKWNICSTLAISFSYVRCYRPPNSSFAFRTVFGIRSTALQ